MPTATGNACRGCACRCRQNSIVLNGRNVFSPADAEIWVASPDSTIAQRSDPYTRRAFRDAHPLDDNYDPQQLGWQWLPHPDGQPGDQGHGGRRPGLDRLRRAPSTTVTNAPVGRRQLLVQQVPRSRSATQPDLDEGPDPAANNAPQAHSTAASTTASPTTTWRTSTTIATTPSPAAILPATQVVPRLAPLPLRGQLRPTTTFRPAMPPTRPA